MDHLVAAPVQPLRFIPTVENVWVVVLHCLSVGFMTGPRAVMYEEYTRYSMLYGDLRVHPPAQELPPILVPAMVPLEELPEGHVGPLARRVFNDVEPNSRSVLPGITPVHDDDLFGPNAILERPVPIVVPSPPRSSPGEYDQEDWQAVAPAEATTVAGPMSVTSDQGEVLDYGDDPMMDDEGVA